MKTSKYLITLISKFMEIKCVLKLVTVHERRVNVPTQVDLNLVRGGSFIHELVEF
jgi:hypothetical protein